MRSQLQQPMLANSQTEPNEEMRVLSNTFTQEGEELCLMLSGWIRRNLIYDKSFAVKRTRTASEIFISKRVTGCIDVALVFLSLMKERGIAASFIETINKQWLEEKTPKKMIEGHIFCRIEINNKEIIYDPMNSTIATEERFFLQSKEYVKILEGKDSWAIGLMTNDDLKKYLILNYQISFS